MPQSHITCAKQSPYTFPINVPAPGEAEAFGQLVGMLVQTVRDGIKNDFTGVLGQVAEPVAARRRDAAQQDKPTPQMLARLLREGAMAQPATLDELAAMVDAPGLLPPEIGDCAAFDDAVAGLPLVQAERPALKRRSRT